jgi:hypothetical protein
MTFLPVDLWQGLASRGLSVTLLKHIFLYVPVAYLMELQIMPIQLYRSVYKLCNSKAHIT